MSICMAHIEHPSGIVARAYQSALDLLRECEERGLAYAPDMSPWAGVDLAESIAWAILSERGYDEDLIDRAVDLDPPDGWSLGDLDAALDASRHNPTPP